MKLLLYKADARSIQQEQMSAFAEVGRPQAAYTLLLQPELIISGPNMRHVVS